MMIREISAPKRAYSKPKLIVYGDLATLTKGGGGSQPEGSDIGNLNLFG